jgi:LL-diaminopimelate aminotransferase
MELAKRLNGIGEYYFSQKLREIDEMNKAGANVIQTQCACLPEL